MRWRTAYAPGLIKSERTVKPLKNALRDEGEHIRGKVKDVAFDSLEKISKRTKKRTIRLN